MSVQPRLDRRALLRGGVAVAGGLIVAFNLKGEVRAAADAFEPNAFVRITPENAVTIFLPRSEMGQGINTSIPMILAEELDVSLDRVEVQFAAPGKSGGINQVTAASTTTRETSKPLREAGAKARAMLVQAAAAKWGVQPQSCTTSDGHVLHAATGRKASYGSLVDAASKLPVPETVTVKAAADYKIVGKSQRRLDSKAKVHGTAVFGIDASPPGVKVAAIVQCPVFGGKLKAVDGAPALKIKGVLKVVPLEDAVAVIADHTGAAKAGLAALTPDWDLGPNAAVNQASIVAGLEAASLKEGVVAHTVGDAKAALAGAAKRVEAVYRQPFLAHAPMEPINCTASVSANRCELWIGHQSPIAARAAAAKASGLTPEQVVIHNHLMGGGFGRKVEVDMINQAVAIAKTVDHPVKLIWSREEDIQHDYYRPYYLDRISAGLDTEGKPVAWSHRVTASSLISRVAPVLMEKMKGVDVDAVEGTMTPYALPNLRVEFVPHESGVRTGFWRGVGTTHTVFVVESFIDECAKAAGADPIAYRQALLTDPRAKAVLALAAEKSGWGKPMAKGWGRGVSMQVAWGTFMAQVAEVEITAEGEAKVRRVVCAVDCGQMINPQTVRAQVEGGIIFGLSATIQGEITFADGRVEQSNFSDYAPTRIGEAPVIEMYLAENHEPSGGIGEGATACVGPAVTNAVFAATALRVRELPLSKASLKQA